MLNTLRNILVELFHASSYCLFKAFHHQSDAMESEWAAEKSLKFFGISKCQRRIVEDLSHALPSKSFFAVLACGKWRDHQYALWRSTLGRQRAAEKQCVLKKGVY